MTDTLMDHATYKVMEKLARSAEGIMLAIRATNAGLPALEQRNMVCRLRRRAAHERDGLCRGGKG